MPPDEAAGHQWHHHGQCVGPRWFRGRKEHFDQTVEYNADGTKKIPEGVKDMAEGLPKGGLRKSLGTVDSKQVPMNCAVAVSNIHYQADLMLEVGQKNVRDGYMTQAAFDTTAPRSARPRANTAWATASRPAATRSRFTSACPAATTT